MSGIKHGILLQTFFLFIIFFYSIDCFFFYLQDYFIFCCCCFYLNSISVSERVNARVRRWEGKKQTKLYDIHDAIKSIYSHCIIYL